jgi:hypothetical protein
MVNAMCIQATLQHFRFTVNLTKLVFKASEYADIATWLSASKSPGISQVVSTTCHVAVCNKTCAVL